MTGLADDVVNAIPYTAQLLAAPGLHLCMLAVGFLKLESHGSLSIRKLTVHSLHRGKKGQVTAVNVGRCVHYASKHGKCCESVLLSFIKRYLQIVPLNYI